MVELNEVYVQKVKFQKLKKAIDINEVDIDCILVLQKYSFKKISSSIVLVMWFIRVDDLIGKDVRVVHNEKYMITKIKRGIYDNLKLTFMMTQDHKKKLDFERIQ